MLAFHNLGVGLYIHQHHHLHQDAKVDTPHNSVDNWYSSNRDLYDILPRYSTAYIRHEGRDMDRWSRMMCMYLDRCTVVLLLSWLQRR
jgi:hypothetical protein